MTCAALAIPAQLQACAGRHAAAYIWGPFLKSLSAWSLLQALCQGAVLHFWAPEDYLPLAACGEQL